MYTLKLIDEKAFQKALTNNAQSPTFLQSLPYFQFRTSQGETLYLLGFYKGSDIQAVALVQQIKTKLKTFTHLPHGPVWTFEPTNNDWSAFLTEYQKWGKTKSVDFVRISPQTSPEHKPIFKKSGYRDAAIHLVNPEKSWFLDLEQSEEALLSGMKKSTRYEVRKSLKPDIGLTVQKGNSPKDLELFWTLHEETVKRQGFVPFSRTATEKELEIFGDKCQIISVLHEEKPLASGVFIFDDNAGYYHQGASIPSKLPAAHAYIWQAILEAKNRGCQHFNFWGVSDEQAVNHPWFGLSKFKRGFGGYEVDYLHVQDYPLKPKYYLTYALEKYRRAKRGY